MPVPAQAEDWFRQQQKKLQSEWDRLSCQDKVNTRWSHKIELITETEMAVCSVTTIERKIQNNEEYVEYLYCKYLHEQKWAYKVWADNGELAEGEIDNLKPGLPDSLEDVAGKAGSYFTIFRALLHAGEIYSNHGVINKKEKLAEYYKSRYEDVEEEVKRTKKQWETRQESTIDNCPPRKSVTTEPGKPPRDPSPPPPDDPIDPTPVFQPATPEQWAELARVMKLYEDRKKEWLKTHPLPDTELPPDPPKPPRDPNSPATAEDWAELGRVMKLYEERKREWLKKNPLPDVQAPPPPARPNGAPADPAVWAELGRQVQDFLDRWFDWRAGHPDFEAPPKPAFVDDTLFGTVLATVPQRQCVAQSLECSNGYKLDTSVVPCIASSPYCKSSGSSGMTIGLGMAGGQCIASIPRCSSSGVATTSSTISPTSGLSGGQCLAQTPQCTSGYRLDTPVASCPASLCKDISMRDMLRCNSLGDCCDCRQGQLVTDGAIRSGGNTDTADSPASNQKAAEDVTVTVRRTEGAELSTVTVQLRPSVGLCSTGPVQMSINGQLATGTPSGQKVVWTQQIPKTQKAIEICQETVGQCVASVPLCSSGYKLDTSVSCGAIPSLQCCLPDCGETKSVKKKGGPGKGVLIGGGAALVGGAVALGGGGGGSNSGTTVGSGTSTGPPPTVNLTITPSGRGLAGLTSYAFSASGSATTWEWNFGDGSTASGPGANHVYATGNRFAVTLTGRSGTQSATASGSVDVGRPMTGSWGGAFNNRNSVLTFSGAGPVLSGSYRDQFDTGLIAGTISSPQGFVCPCDVVITISVPNNPPFRFEGQRVGDQLIGAFIGEGFRTETVLGPQ